MSESKRLLICTMTALLLLGQVLVVQAQTVDPESVGLSAERRHAGYFRLMYS